MRRQVGEPPRAEGNSAVSGWLRGLLEATGVYILLGVGIGVARRLGWLPGMSISLHLLAALVAAHVFLQEPLRGLPSAVRRGIEAALVVVATYVGLRLLDRLIFDLIGRRRATRGVPVVIRDIVRWFLTAGVIFAVLRTCFPTLNLNVLAVSSLVVGYIVGNATQDTLGNLIAGLALNTENPFSLGDWVTIGGYTGRVTDMTWRATCLKTKDRDYVIIPNSVIAREPIINFSRPDPVHRHSVDIGVSYEVPPNKVRRVLLAAAGEVPQILRAPEPQVRLVQYGDFAILYRVRYYVDEFENLEQIQGRFLDLVWYRFKREGIVIPYPIRDVRVTQPVVVGGRREERTTDEETGVLAGVDLFAPLSEAERRVLAEELREEVYAAGEILVKEGEAGTTFFLIRSGQVRVTVTRSGREIEIAALGPGDCFGEMSLLTGEPRNATVTALTDVEVLVLPHRALASVLRSNATLADALARQLERRRRELAQRVQPSDGAPVEPLPSHGHLLAAIRRFFGL